MGTLVSELPICAQWMTSGNLFDDPAKEFGPIPDDCNKCSPDISCGHGYLPLASDPIHHSVPWNYATSLSGYLDCDGSPSQVYRIQYGHQKYHIETIVSNAGIDEPASIQLGWYPGGCNGLSIFIYSHTYTYIGNNEWRHDRYYSYPYFATWSMSNNEIPPCYRLDPLTGLLTYDKTLPGCDDFDCYKYECVDIIGPSSIVCGNTYTYTAHIIGTIEECGQNKFDRTVYLSYGGSTVSHNGPSTITIPAGSTSVKFNVYIDSVQVGMLIINSGSTIDENCTEQRSVVYCDGIINPPCPECYVEINGKCIYDSSIPGCSGGGGGGAPPYTEPELPFTCCDYMPKDFIAWSDGWNLRQLVPPNQR